MVILIKEVEPWPISIAREDLRASMALYYYARYGLEMRDKLEIEGPYEFSHKDINYLNRIGIFAGSDEQKVEFFERHQTQILIAAAHQFVLNAYAIFDFFIANLIIFIYSHCISTAPNPETGFQFLWSDIKRKEFLGNAVVADIEEDAWMKRHHKMEVVKERTKFIEEVCGVNIHDYNTGDSAIISDWSKFTDYRSLRHSIAHSAGRKSLYVDDALQKHSVDEKHLLDLDSYISKILSYINHQLYGEEIIDYIHKIDK